jgi:hypothetical protein
LHGRRGGVHFSAALVQLGRTLVGTGFGTEQVGSGWPSVALELTARAFDLGGRSPNEGRGGCGVGRRFLDTMLEASARELVIVFGWPPAAAHAVLGALVDRGEASWRRARTGPACSAGTRPGGSEPDFLRARDLSVPPAVLASPTRPPLICRSMYHECPMLTAGRRPSAAQRGHGDVAYRGHAHPILTSARSPARWRGLGSLCQAGPVRERCRHGGRHGRLRPAAMLSHVSAVVAHLAPHRARNARSRGGERLGEQLLDPCLDRRGNLVRGKAVCPIT